MDENTLREARSLRTKGLTYRQIVIELEGRISLDQCKRNLKGVKAVDKYTLLYEQALALSKRQEGVTDKELTDIAFKILGTVEKGDINRLKAKIKRKKSDDQNSVLVRPAWMSPTTPAKSLVMMNELSHELYENIQHLVDRYIEQYPDTDRKKALQEMVYLSNGWALKESLERRMERNYRTVERIEK